MSASLRDYLWMEARAAPRRAAVGLALGGIGAVVLSHLVIPRFPVRVIAFMELGFRLDGLAAVLLFNDIVAVSFAVFFAGLIGLLDVLVAAREGHRLEILLAKPIHPATFLIARTLPVLAASVAVGVVVSMACAVAIVPHLDADSTVGVAGALGAGLFLTALALVQLGVLVVVLVGVRDSFYGMLIASLFWLATMMPAAVLMYRPDLFAGHDALASAITLPSLLWHADVIAWLGPLALLVAVPIAGLFVRVAGVRLARTDAM